MGQLSLNLKLMAELQVVDPCFIVGTIINMLGCLKLDRDQLFQGASVCFWSEPGFNQTTAFSEDMCKQD